MAQTVAIIGENGVGKTHLALALADKIESSGKSVIIVNFDVKTPASPYLVKDSTKYKTSLGYLLTKESVPTKNEIINALIPLSENIALLSFVYGDYYKKYPAFVEHRVTELFDTLYDIADYIILDCQSNVKFVTTRKAISFSDKVIYVAEPGLKGLSFFDTFSRLTIDQNKFDKSKYTLVFNKTKYYHHLDIIASKMGYDSFYSLPYLDEISKNEYALELFNPLIKIDYDTKLYKVQLYALINSLFHIDIEEDEVFADNFASQLEEEEKLQNNQQESTQETQDKAVKNTKKRGFLSKLFNLKRRKNDN